MKNLLKTVALTLTLTLTLIAGNNAHAGAITKLLGESMEKVGEGIINGLRLNGNDAAVESIKYAAGKNQSDAVTNKIRIGLVDALENDPAFKDIKNKSDLSLDDWGKVHRKLAELAENELEGVIPCDAVCAGVTKKELQGPIFFIPIHSFSSPTEQAMKNLPKNLTAMQDAIKTLIGEQDIVLDNMTMTQARRVLVFLRLNNSARGKRGRFLGDIKSFLGKDGMSAGDPMLEIVYKEMGDEQMSAMIKDLEKVIQEGHGTVAARKRAYSNAMEERVKSKPSLKRIWDELVARKCFGLGI